MSKVDIYVACYIGKAASGTGLVATRDGKVTYKVGRALEPVLSRYEVNVTLWIRL